MVIRCRESSDYLHLSRGVCHGSGIRGWTGAFSKFLDKNNLWTGRLREGKVEKAMEEISATYVVRRWGG